MQSRTASNFPGAPARAGSSRTDPTDEPTQGLGVSPGEEGGRTTELDRRALDGVALPFASSPEPPRASFPNRDDGALPFRATPSAPPPAPAPPPSYPATTASPPPPSYPAAAPVSSPVSAPAPAPAASAPRSELGDLFRRAFGMAGAAGANGAAAASASTGASASTSGAPAARAWSAPVAAVASSPRAESAPSPASARPAAIETAASPARAASDAAVARDLGASVAEAAIPATPAPLRRRLVDLLAFDPALPPRVRRARSWGPLLAVPPAPRSRIGVDAATDEPPQEERGRLDVLRLLSFGAPADPRALAGSLEAALDDPHDLEIPVFLVEGEVRPTWDEVEALRAAVQLVKPFAGAHRRTGLALAAASEALERSVPPSPEAATALLKQLDAASGELPLPVRHVPEQVERSLREARAYKRRNLLGAPRIRAELTLGSASFPLYLPEAAGTRLPLLPSFPVVALVESRPREDASEASSTALVALAVGRVLQSRA